MERNKKEWEKEWEKNNSVTAATEELSSLALTDETIERNIEEANLARAVAASIANMSTAAETTPPGTQVPTDDGTEDDFLLDEEEEEGEENDVEGIDWGDEENWYDADYDDDLDNLDILPGVHNFLE